ncbi:hypothetical protein MNV49_007845 [Pseudohyphozyma bogoriensis]|nr:hypothetical protein MNV49_007845 [Pseudohyphozyma bogoriensis]
MDSKSLTLYTSKSSTWGNRATWVLEEVGAKYEVYNIDYKAKPPSYFTKVNPAGLVPVLQIGPSLEDSIKIPESAVIVEYITEVFPQAKLLTSDPLKNAHCRYFAERTKQTLWDAVMGVLVRKDFTQAPRIFSALAELQTHFDKYPGKYLVGDELTLGDILVGALFARTFAFAEGGVFVDIDPDKTILSDPRWAGLRAYNATIAERPAFQRTFDKQFITQHWLKKRT